MLRVVHTLELKQGKYDHLNTTMQNKQELNSKLKRISNLF